MDDPRHGDARDRLAELEAKLLELEHELLDGPGAAGDEASRGEPGRAGEAPPSAEPPPSAEAPPSAEPPPSGEPPQATDQQPARTVDAELPGVVRHHLVALRATLEHLADTSEELRVAAREVADDHARTQLRLERAGAAAARVIEAATGTQAPAAPWRGSVVVEAGPFAEPEALASFRAALAGVPGARDVYLRAFEQGRAVIEVELGE